MTENNRRAEPGKPEEIWRLKELGIFNKLGMDFKKIKNVKLLYGDKGFIKLLWDYNEEKQEAEVLLDFKKKCKFAEAGDGIIRIKGQNAGQLVQTTALFGIIKGEREYDIDIAKFKSIEKVTEEKGSIIIYEKMDVTSEGEQYIWSDVKSGELVTIGEERIGNGLDIKYYGEHYDIKGEKLAFGKSIYNFSEKGTLAREIVRVVLGVDNDRQLKESLIKRTYSSGKISVIDRQLEINERSLA
ncbi:MAG TPA: hypothetical protein DEG71_01775 [Clostridiales bacterium]|nr:hypothetical protein [Clostridiales bacterium]